MRSATSLHNKQTANMHPYLSVCKSLQQTWSHSDLQWKCHQRSSKYCDPNLDATTVQKMTSTAVARRGWSVPWLSYRFIEKMCLKSVLLGLPDPNKANATGSLSTHFGFTQLTKSCVTNEQSEPVSNIIVATVTP